MRIDPGRLVEAPCPHCGHIERRAFGDSESDRGELASYALGWTSGHEEVHIAPRVDDGTLGMQLVDTPFEDVPEGGRDLTREQALAHPDLPYVWHVADEVMLQDRRAWWMEHDLRGTRAFATEPVLGGEAVRSVVHDDEGDWQLLCGTVPPDDPRLMHLHHAVDRDAALLEVLDLEPGQRADREAPGAPWRRGPDAAGAA